MIKHGWHITTTHHDCAECDALAASAVQDSQETGGGERAHSDLRHHTARVRPVT